MLPGRYLFAPADTQQLQSVWTLVAELRPPSSAVGFGTALALISSPPVLWVGSPDYSVRVPSWSPQHDAPLGLVSTYVGNVSAQPGSAASIATWTFAGNFTIPDVDARIQTCLPLVDAFGEAIAPTSYGPTGVGLANSIDLVKMPTNEVVGVFGAHDWCNHHEIAGLGDGMAWVVQPAEPGRYEAWTVVSELVPASSESQDFGTAVAISSAGVLVGDPNIETITSRACACSVLCSFACYLLTGIPPRRRANQGWDW